MRDFEYAVGRTRQERQPHEGVEDPEAGSQHLRR